MASDDLEFDPAFIAMAAAAMGIPPKRFGDKGEFVIEGKEPNWLEVRSKAMDLMGRTEDLRVACYLAKAELAMNGLAGFTNGLRQAVDLLSQHWDVVHPIPYDESDPVRLNTLLELDSPVTIGLLPRHDDFMSVTDELCQANLDAVVQARESVSEIIEIIRQKPGSNNERFRFVELDSKLESIQEVLSAAVAQLETTGDDGTGSSAAPHESPGRDGPVDSRDFKIATIRSSADAERALEHVLAYYESNEPSSPVPLLIKLSCQLISKDFVSIRRVLEDVPAELERILGELRALDDLPGKLQIILNELPSHNDTTDV